MLIALCVCRCLGGIKPDANPSASVSGTSLFRVAEKPGYLGDSVNFDLEDLRAGYCMPPPYEILLYFLLVNCGIYEYHLQNIALAEPPLLVYA